jgi:hypothetical protein
MVFPQSGFLIAPTRGFYRIIKIKKLNFNIILVQDKVIHAFSREFTF